MLFDEVTVSGRSRIDACMPLFATAFSPANDAGLIPSTGVVVFLNERTSRVTLAAVHSFSAGANHRLVDLALVLPLTLLGAQKRHYDLTQLIRHLTAFTRCSPSGHIGTSIVTDFRLIFSDTDRLNVIGEVDRFREPEEADVV